MSTTITTNADDLDGLAPLFIQYDGQINPQPAYIEIEQDGTVTADWSGEIGNGVPASVWHRVDIRIPVSPCVSGRALVECMKSEEFLALVGRVVDGGTEEWDGSNYVGKYTDDAEKAMEQLERLLETLDQVQCWTTSDYFDGVTNFDKDSYLSATVGDDTITADTTDQELQVIAKKLIEEAGGEGVYLTTDPVEFLTWVRNELNSAE